MFINVNIKFFNKSDREGDLGKLSLILWRRRALPATPYAKMTTIMLAYTKFGAYLKPQRIVKGSP